MIAAGDDFTVALRSDGTVWSWGKNTYGQLGTGIAFDQNGRSNAAQEAAKNTPVQVIFRDGAGAAINVNILSIAVGSNHVLAVTDEGKMYAWGLNNFGQLGVNNEVGAYSTPQLVTAAGGQGGTLEKVARVAAGDEFSMALLENGSVYTWGNNTYGQLGINSYQKRTSPARLLGYNGGGYMSSVAGIAAGGSHGMVIRSDGAVFSWGLNSSGQLGNGDTTNWNVPTKVLGTTQDAGSSTGEGYLTNISLLTAGTSHTVALTREGHVLSWGNNSVGQVGNGSTSGKGVLVPALVRNANDGEILENVVEISAGGNHTVALSATWYTCSDCPIDSDPYLLKDLIPKGMENPIDTTGTMVDGELVYTHCPEKHIYYTSSPNYEQLTCDNGHTFNKNGENTTSSNTVYAWGGDSNGELGVTEKDNKTVTQATETLFSKGNYAYSTYFDNYTNKAFGLAAGNGHTAILGNDCLLYTSDAADE